VSTMLTESGFSIASPMRLFKGLVRLNRGCKTISSLFEGLSVLTTVVCPMAVLGGAGRWRLTTKRRLYLLTMSKAHCILVFVIPAKEPTMPILSPKRQVTLPKELCDRLRVRPGDQVEFLEHNGRITILKKARGSSAGVLRHLKPDTRFSDEESLRDALASKRAKATAKRRAA
jgi:AbrB family looped-hinge helix DNA binding protein